MSASEPLTGNLLLGRLSDQDYSLLESHVERVPFEAGSLLHGAGAAIENVFFPEDGVASLHDVLESGTRVGIGTVGREGFTGWEILLGAENARHEAMVGISGQTALRIASARLLDACRESPMLNSLLLRFVQTLLTQMGRTIVSNLYDPAERRLARWLLMNHDRIEGDAIALTHNQIGIMLGVRRATVTDALHVLEGEQLIRCSRGQISIRDRTGLKRMSGESYGPPEAEYRQLLAPFGKDMH
jgi:CRP-like cAMP-binding protein